MFFKSRLLAGILILISAFSFVAVYALPTTANVLAQRFQPPAWLGLAYDDPKFLQKTDKKSFNKTLTGITLGNAMQNKGKNNKGVYTITGTYQGHTGSDLILKVLPSAKAGYGEVKALHEVGELIDSGMLRNKQLSRFGSLVKTPVIIMKKKTGEMLYESEAYKSAAKEPELQKRMKKEAIDKTCEEVASLAVNKKLFHADNQAANVLFKFSGTTVSEVQLIDFGGQGVFNVKSSVSKDEAKAYCYTSTRALWVFD